MTFEEVRALLGLETTATLVPPIGAAKCTPILLGLFSCGDSDLAATAREEATLSERNAVLSKTSPDVRGRVVRGATRAVANDLNGKSTSRAMSPAALARSTPPTDPVPSLDRRVSGGKCKSRGDIPPGHPLSGASSCWLTRFVRDYSLVKERRRCSIPQRSSAPLAPTRILSRNTLPAAQKWPDFGAFFAALGPAWR